MSEAEKGKEDPVNAALRERSGAVTDDRALVSFLYELMRDHVTPGDVESLVRTVESEDGPECLFSNGWLAQYAKDLADRLTPS